MTRPHLVTPIQALGTLLHTEELAKQRRREESKWMKQNAPTLDSGLDVSTPSEHDRFKEGLRQILSVSKDELDRREAEWRREQEAKKKRKKKAG
jgi:hypothetical protein